MIGAGRRLYRMLHKNRENRFPV